MIPTTHTIFAWTEATPPEGYPAYVNISRDDKGKHTITVRSRGDGGRNTAVMEIPVEALESLLRDLAADLYREAAQKLMAPDGVRVPDAADRMILDAGIASGHEGTAKFAAQLAGVPACDGCGYRKEFCRCGTAGVAPARAPLAVAWRVKMAGGKWVLFDNEQLAHATADASSLPIQSLAVIDGVLEIDCKTDRNEPPIHIPV